MEFNDAWGENHLHMSSSENRNMLSNACGCRDCSISLHGRNFQYAEFKLATYLLSDHSRHTSFKEISQLSCSRKNRRGSFFQKNDISFINNRTDAKKPTTVQAFFQNRSRGSFVGFWHKITQYCLKHTQNSKYYRPIIVFTLSPLVIRT